MSNDDRRTLESLTYVMGKEKHEESELEMNGNKSIGVSSEIHVTKGSANKTVIVLKDIDVSSPSAPEIVIDAITAFTTNSKLDESSNNNHPTDNQPKVDLREQDNSSSPSNKSLMYNEAHDDEGSEDGEIIDDDGFTSHHLQTNNEESCEHGISLYECEHECEEILSGSASQNNEKNDERLNSDHEITHFASFGCVRPRLSPSQVERRIRAIPPPEFVYNLDHKSLVRYVTDLLYLSNEQKRLLEGRQKQLEKMITMHAEELTSLRACAHSINELMKTGNFPLSLGCEIRDELLGVEEFYSKVVSRLKPNNSASDSTAFPHSTPTLGAAAPYMNVIQRFPCVNTSTQFCPFVRPFFPIPPPFVNIPPPVPPKPDGVVPGPSSATLHNDPPLVNNEKVISDAGTSSSKIITRNTPSSDLNGNSAINQQAVHASTSTSHLISSTSHSSAENRFTNRPVSPRMSCEANRSQRGLPRNQFPFPRGNFSYGTRMRPIFPFRRMDSNLELGPFRDRGTIFFDTGMHPFGIQRSMPPGPTDFRSFDRDRSPLGYHRNGYNNIPPDRMRFARDLFVMSDENDEQFRNSKKNH